MKQRLKKWWSAATLNEKMMYGLLIVLTIGIATRWRYVVADIADAFTSMFSR